MDRMKTNQAHWHTLLVVLVILAIAGCKTQEVTSVWANTPIHIDGNTEDWMDVPGILFTEQNAALAVSNDNEFLYVQFKTTGPRWVRTIKMTGLTLYLNSENKKKKDFFIRFKGGPTQEQLIAMGDDRTSFSPAGGNPPIPHFEANGEPSLTCYIKDRILEKSIPLDGSEGPHAAFDTSRGFYTYEFSIPLDKGSVRYYGIDAIPGQQITIGAEWGGIPEGMQRPEVGMGRPGGSGMKPGGGGRSGGMGGRGGMKGGGEGRPEMPQKQEAWLEIELAIPPKTGLEQDQII